jgi:hypothetical protein
MAKAIELILTLLQLGPIFVLSVSPNPLSRRLPRESRYAETKEPEGATTSS